MRYKKELEHLENCRDFFHNLTDNVNWDDLYDQKNLLITVQEDLNGSDPRYEEKYDAIESILSLLDEFQDLCDDMIPGDVVYRKLRAISKQREEEERELLG